MIDIDVVELVAHAPSPQDPVMARLHEVAFRPDAWLPSDLARLAAMFREEASLGEIAGALGRTIRAVSTKIYELGLRRGTSRQWTPEDDALLMQHYPTAAAGAVAGLLGRTTCAIYARAGVLGLTEPQAALWTEWEDCQLRRAYELGMPTHQIAVVIGRPHSGICSRAGTLRLRHPSHQPDWEASEMARALELAEAGFRYRAIAARMVEEGFPDRGHDPLGQMLRKLGYGRGWGRPWTPEEDDLLRVTYANGLSTAPLRDRLGRTKWSIRWRVEELGLRHPKPDGFRLGPVWSDEETAHLKATYGKVKPKEIARQLGRDLRAVYQRAFALGLKTNRYRDWTADEDRAIALAFERNISLGALVPIFRRDLAVVSKRAIKLGFSFKRRGRGTSDLGSDPPSTVAGLLDALTSRKRLEQGL